MGPAAPATKKTNRSRILSQFTVGVADQLLTFADSLADVQTDVLMFMARKSYCLYDVLVSIGARPAGAIVTSDRVLDFDLSAFRGKQVTLVDDTLFVGSTLHRCRQAVLDAGASEVRVEVFCRNRDWHDARLVEPDVVALDLDDASTRTFCSAAVRALSVAPRPYNADFPRFEPERLSLPDLDTLLSSVRWDPVNLTSEHQARNGVRAYTFFPSDEVMEEFASTIGTDIVGATHVDKVRAFVRVIPERGVAWMTIVPMVLSAPLPTDALEDAVSAVAKQAGIDESTISSWAPSGRARLKLVQTWMSIALGCQFLDDTGAALGRNLRCDLNIEELGHHLGPWRQNEIRRVVSAAKSARDRRPVPINLSGRAKPPQSALAIPADLAHAELLKSGDEATGRDLVAEFGQLFVGMYDRRELPARRAMLSADDPVQVIHSSEHDRLSAGVSFAALQAFFERRFLRRHSRTDSARILSLVLDVCNDLGIAVPITVEEDGWIWRGYRHGEDVKFTDAEVDLAYYSVAGYLEATGRGDIPALVLEKLLTLLIRLGAARGFIEPLYGDTSVSHVVQIQMDLKGAIPKIRTGHRRTANSDRWLTDYLQHRKVITRLPQRTYRLGQPVDATFVSSDAPESAREIGSMVGLALKSSRVPDGISERELVILATVEPPRDGLAAVAAELDIVAEHFEQRWASELPAELPSDRESLEALRTALVRSRGYEAIHSARMKLAAILTGEHATIVEKVGQILESDGSVASRRFAARWRGYWEQATTGSDAVQERAEAMPLLMMIAEGVWELAANVLTAEVAVAGALLPTPRGSRTHFVRVLEKFYDYCRVMRTLGIECSCEIERLEHRLRDPANADWGTEYASAVSQLGEAVGDVPGRLSAVDPLVQARHGFANRKDYSYLIWYDVVDSTSTLSGRRGEDVDRHDEHVSRFRQAVNRSLQSLVITARKQDTEVYAWNGDVNSSNDEKHVFFAGPRALQNAKRMMSDLSHALLACPGVQVRVYCVQGDFAGAKPYRYDTDVEVQSPRFWEHLSRVKSALRSEEETRARPGESFIAMVGDRLVGSYGAVRDWSLRGVTSLEIESEAHFLQRRTRVSVACARPSTSR